MTQLAVQASALTFYYGSRPAVDHLDLVIPTGIVFGLLGPNGAGKTTTLRLLLGLLVPDGGSIAVFGLDPVSRGSAVRSRAGVLLEHTGLYERLSAYDNLEFFGRLMSVPARERRTRIEALLRHFGLWDRRREAAGAWSRGMKQRLAIARALLHRPPLVLLDEPTEGLDPVAAATLRSDIATLAREEGTTVVLTTHDLVVADRLCERIAIIRAGAAVATGSPGELRSDTGLQRFEIEATGVTTALVTKLLQLPGVRRAHIERDRLDVIVDRGTEFAAIASTIHDSSVQIARVNDGTPSLEDVYWSLMDPGDRRVA